MVILTMSNINEWCLKTVEIAKKENYLDKLLEIYPAELPPPRPLSASIKNEIIKLYNEKKYRELVKFLLSLRENPFPIEHPYASLLRHLNVNERENVIVRNPKLLEILSGSLVSLGLNNIIKGVERPKDINRALGAAFKSWIHKNFVDKPFKVVKDVEHLLACTHEIICMYAGSDVEISRFIKQRLLLHEPEEGFYNRDIIIRLRDMYIIGEARFLSTPGGSQTRDLENTLMFVELMENIGRDLEKKGIRVKGIVLLDGIVWFYEEYLKRIKNKATGNRVIMSALFLRDYLLDIFNKSL